MEKMGMDRFKIVKRCIDEYDYDSLLAQGAPADEFDSYSRAIAAQVHQEMTVEEIAARLAEQLDHPFGTEICPEKFTTTARDIKLALFPEAGNRQ